MTDDDRPRFHPNDPSLLTPISPSQAHAYLVESLTRLTDTTRPSTPWTGSFSSGACRGLFAGPTSIAYLFLHLSHTHPDLTISSKTASRWCTEYLSSSPSSLSAPPSTSAGCGIANEGLAHLAVLAAHTCSSDPATSDGAVSALVAASSALATPPQFNEWLQGRAGTLALLRIARRFCPARAADIDAAVEGLVAHILAHGAPSWTHAGKHLLGAAHGDIGILTQLVLSSSSSAATAAAVEPRLDTLLDAQTERGNWHTSSAKHRELVQWCHGAPGFALCLRALRPHFPRLRNRIDVALQKARALTWAEGLLVKEPSLCHGVHGNALAFGTGDARRARLVSAATPEKMRAGLESGYWVAGSDPVGLLWGEAGRAWAWAGMDGGREGFPGFTDV